MRTTILLGVLLAALGVAGCGDDSSQSTSADLSMTMRDLSGQPTACTASDVATTCATASGNNECFVCDTSGGGGVCARVCSLLAQDCPTGESCREFSFVGDGGTPSGIVMAGPGCSGFGYCK